MQLIRLQLARGEIPGAALIDGACIFIGGIALLMPGFISDTLGFLLLMPYTRNIFKVGLKWLLANWIRSRGFVIIRKWD